MSSICNEHHGHVSFQFIYIPLEMCLHLTKTSVFRKLELSLEIKEEEVERKERKKIINPHLNGETTIPYLRESVWFLYSSMVLGGRFKTRRRVSRIRVVVA